MVGHQKKILFLLFFLSGFCGLLDQVIWVRLSFASFGVITPVLSVVISCPFCSEDGDPTTLEEQPQNADSAAELLRKDHRFSSHR